MDEDVSGETAGEIPRLTLMQRALAALPSLDRQKTRTSASTSAAATRKVSTDKRSGAVEPDEVTTQDGATGDKANAGATARARTTPSKPRPAVGTSRAAVQAANMGNEELTTAIKRIDDRERLYALFCGPLGAVIGIVLTIIAIHTNPALHHKDHVAVSTIVFEGIARVVFGAAVFGIGFTRRRSLVAFALLFLGLTLLPFGIIFMGLGGWMLLRASRYQKALTARGIAPPRGRGAQPPRAAAKSGATDARQRLQERKEARARKRGKQPVPTGPPASKRYTPPKPTRPRPPPAS
ncbi:MAG: hypothetical protein ACRDV4_12810 [Acidimicrobiales bacterium]